MSVGQNGSYQAGHETDAERDSGVVDAEYVSEATDLKYVSRATDDLRAAASRYFALAPWDVLQPRQVYAVVNPDDGEIGYCSVFGRASIHRSLVVYRGTRGYKQLCQILSGVNASDSEEFLYQDSLTASLEPSGAPTLVNSVFWSHKTGFVPECLTDLESKFLAHVLQASTYILQKMDSQPDLFVLPDGFVPLLQHHADGWTVLPHQPDVASLTHTLTPKWVQLDELRVQRIKRSAHRIADWDVDFSYAPLAVKSEGRDYFPVLCLWTDSQSGDIVGSVLSPHGTFSADIVNVFLDSLERWGVPNQMHVKSAHVRDMFSAVAARLGIKLQLVEAMPQLDSVRDTLLGELMQPSDG